VGGDAALTLYDNVLDHPFSLNVDSNAVLNLDHSYFPSGIPYATIEGSLVISKSDINTNCILSVPGQTQFSQHGLILDQSNTTRATQQWSYSEKLTNGDSFNLNVTESAFSNSKVKAVDFSIGIYLGESGSNTVSVFYDSSTGEKLGKTTTFSDLDGRVKIVSFSVSDARFSSDTSDIRIQVSDPAAAAGLSYIWVRGNPSIEPPFDLTASSGAGFVSIDWKGKSHWQFGSYSVHRSTVSGGPYTQIATGITATAFTDESVVGNTTYYYVVKTVDSSGNETGPSSGASAKAFSYFSYTGVNGAWETSGHWSSGASWTGPFTAAPNLPKPTSEVVLGGANVTLSSVRTIDEIRIGDRDNTPGGAGSLTLTSGAVLNASLATIAQNREGTLTISAGASFISSGNVIASYRNKATIDVSGTMTLGNDLRLQFSGAYARAYPSVINVHSGGVVDAGGKLSIGGDDGGTYLGLNGTLNIFEGGVVKADGWDLRKGAHVVINAGSLLQIEGNQITAANGYIGSGYITSATLISVTYDAGQNQTLISAAIPPGGYDAWASANGIGAADADDDGDGWENLLEFAIGGNPKSGSDTKPAIVKIGNSLRYSFKRRNDDSSLTFVLALLNF
jgi:hypothetical protein